MLNKGWGVDIQRTPFGTARWQTALPIFQEGKPISNEISASAYECDRFTGTANPTQKPAASLSIHVANDNGLSFGHPNRQNGFAFGGGVGTDYVVEDSRRG